MSHAYFDRLKLPPLFKDKKKSVTKDVLTEADFSIVISSTEEKTSNSKTGEKKLSLLESVLEENKLKYGLGSKNTHSSTTINQNVRSGNITNRRSFLPRTNYSQKTPNGLNSFNQTASTNAYNETTNKSSKLPDFKTRNINSSKKVSPVIQRSISHHNFSPYKINNSNGFSSSVDNIAMNNRKSMITRSTSHSDLYIPKNMARYSMNNPSPKVNTHSPLFPPGTNSGQSRKIHTSQSMNFLNRNSIANVNNNHNISKTAATSKKVNIPKSVSHNNLNGSKQSNIGSNLLGKKEKVKQTISNKNSHPYMNYTRKSVALPRSMSHNNLSSDTRGNRHSTTVARNPRLSRSVSHNSLNPYNAGNENTIMPINDNMNNQSGQPATTKTPTQMRPVSNVQPLFSYKQQQLNNDKIQSPKINRMSQSSKLELSRKYRSSAHFSSLASPMNHNNSIAGFSHGNNMNNGTTSFNQTGPVLSACQKQRKKMQQPFVFENGEKFTPKCMQNLGNNNNDIIFESEDIKVKKIYNDCDYDGFGILMKPQSNILKDLKSKSYSKTSNNITGINDFKMDDFLNRIDNITLGGNEEDEEKKDNESTIIEIESTHFERKDSSNNESDDNNDSVYYYNSISSISLMDSPLSSEHSNQSTKRVKFNTVMKIGNTYTCGEYDRKEFEDGTNTAFKMHNMFIKVELNEYKINEMIVHPDSMGNMHFMQ